MAQTIKLRRSSTEGKVPTAAQLALGELAINTHDGRIFFEKNDGSATIEHILTTDSITTGSVTLTGKVTSATLTLSGLSAQNSEATSLMINGSGVVGTRELGSNAFTSTTIGTTSNALTDGTGIADFSFDGSGTATISTDDGAIVHDNLSGFVANEHIDHSSVSITAGTGLNGGGTIASTRTLNVDDEYLNTSLNSFTASNANTSLNAATGSYLTTVDISANTNLAGGTGITLTGDTLSTTDSEIVHDNLSGFVSNEHIDHSSVSITAGTGLNGGGTIASTRTLNVDSDYLNTSLNSFTASNANTSLNAATSSYLTSVDISDDTNLTGGTGITLTGDTLSTTDSDIVHDNLSGFVANEHIDHSSVSITAGNGLTGGGTIASTRTLSIDLDGSTLSVGTDGIKASDGILNTSLNSFTASNANTSLNAATGSYLTSVRSVTAGGNTLASGETLAFTAGTNVSISESGGAVTITSTDTNTQLSTSDVRGKFSAGEGIDISSGEISGEDASTSNKGIVELATTAETTTGTDTARAVTPDGLKDGYQGSTNVTTLGTIATGTWNGTAIDKTYLDDEVYNTSLNSATASYQPKPSEGAFADGDKTKLDGIDTSADVTDATTVKAALNGNLGTLTLGDSNDTVSIPGNLSVAGTRTFVESTTVQLDDNILELNGGGTADGGIYVRDAEGATTVTGSLIWNTGDDKWTAGPKGSEDDIVLATATQTLTNKTLTSPDVNSPDIDGGNIDGATIATSDITVGSGKTLNVSGGTLTTSTAQKVAIIGGGDTDNLSEGSSNQYFTTARARAAISAGEGIDISSGEISGEDASATNKGIVELATTAETTTGTDTARAVTPDGLKDGYQGSTNVTTLGTIATGTWNGTAIDKAYLDDEVYNTSLNAATGSYITSVRSVTAGGNTLASGETLAFTAGSNISISESGGAVTITSTDTNTQNTTTLSFVDSSNDIILRNTTGGAGSGTDDIKFVAGSNITLTHTDADNITIASTDTNTQLTTEQVEDIVDGLIVGGTNVTSTYDDAAGTLTLSSTDTNTQLSTSDVRGKFSAGEGIDISSGEISGEDASATNKGIVELATTAETTTGTDTARAVTPDGLKDGYQGSTNVTTLGTIATGTWNGSVIDKAYIDDELLNTSLNAATGSYITSVRTVTAGGNTLASSETLAFTAGSNVSISESGGAVTITSTDTNTQLTQENVEDFVGGMLDGTETGITVGYDDTNGNIDFVVSDTTVAGDSGTTGITPGDTLTIAGGTNVTTAMSGDTLTITSTDTNTQLSTSDVRGKFSAGEGIDISSGEISGEDASTTNKGIVELATTAETTTGTDTARAVTPDGLKDGYQGSTNVTTLGTIATGTWNGTVIDKAYLDDEVLNTSLNSATGSYATGDNFDNDGTFSSLRAQGTTKGDVGLGNVENTALSTYTGNGGALDNQYITNGAGYTTNTGDITGITTAANSGLAGGATSGTPSLTLDIDNLAASTLPDVSEDDMCFLDYAAGDNITKVTGIRNFLSASIDGITLDQDSTGKFIKAKTATVSNGGAALATGNQIYDFVIGLGYSTTTGTVDTSGTPVDNDFAKFTDANTIEGRSISETKSDLSLNNVENTAISTFAGSTNITTLGTIGTGTWNGSVIASAYLDSDTAHLSGTQTFSGAKTFSNSTSSTSKTTGAVIVTGGVGISGALNVGGDVTAFASSDERYKDLITPIQNPNEKIKLLSGNTFVWNDKHEIYKGKKDIGVIAQEVEKVLPEIVETRDNGYKAVKYEKIVALLIESNKELIKRVEELESKIK